MEPDIDLDSVSLGSTLMDKQKSHQRRREEGRFSSYSSDGLDWLTHLTHTQSFGVAHFCYCKINDDDDDDYEKSQRQEAAGCSQVFPDI